MSCFGIKLFCRGVVLLPCGAARAVYDECLSNPLKIQHKNIPAAFRRHIRPEILFGAIMEVHSPRKQRIRSPNYGKEATLLHDDLVKHLRKCSCMPRIKLGWIFFSSIFNK